MKKNKKNMIWTYDFYTLDNEEREIDYKEIFDANYDEEKWYSYLFDLNEDYLSDVRSEVLFKERNEGEKQYVILGDLGLWYGRVPGGKIIRGLWNAIAQCFEDYNEIYEENGMLTIIAHHHDGTNIFKIKELTERGEKFVENHKYNIRDKDLHKKLFEDRHYSKHVAAFKQIYGW